jgi:hypothetical protein
LDNSESEETLGSDNKLYLRMTLSLTMDLRLKRLRKLIVMILSGLRTWTMRTVETLRLALISLTMGFPTVTRKPSLAARDFR